MLTLIVQKSIALNFLKKVTFLTFSKMAIKFNRIIFLFVFILIFFLVYTLKKGRLSMFCYFRLFFALLLFFWKYLTLQDK